jgi:hypothetical protein
MSLGKVVGITGIALGIISLILMILFGWDVSLQILSLQKDFLKEYWYLLITTFISFLGGIILLIDE